MKEIEDMVNKYIRASLKGIDLSDDFLNFFAVLSPTQQEYCGKLYDIMDGFYCGKYSRETAGQKYRALKNEYENYA